MKPVNGKILVHVNLKQKDLMTINGVTVYTALKYELNNREKSPTVAVVVEGNKYVNENDILLCHHNLFSTNSPYYLQDNLFSIPFSKVLFAKIKEDGGTSAICGNIICNEIQVPSLITLSKDLQKVYKNKYEIVDAGWTKFKKGDIIFTRPSSGYTIVYNWNSIENRIVKVDSDMICGVLR